MTDTETRIAELRAAADDMLYMLTPSTLHRITAASTMRAMADELERIDALAKDRAK